ncbi:MAG: hypothetical protein ACR2PG_02340 [Hyphomicrobiaceae bacterium]
MPTTIDQRRMRVVEAKNLLPVLASEYNELSLAIALGKTVDLERYARVDRQLRHIELTIDTDGLCQPAPRP